jgi:crossover junction endodeoxyribonuclease RuvC
MANSRIILGVDPGTTIMGFGIIEVVGQKLNCLQLNELKLSQYESHYVRLGHIYARTAELIKTYQPSEMALEAPFFGKNVQSMLKLGRAQGVAIAAGIAHDLAIYEYSPRKIKMAITGNGNASKEQVAKMLKQMVQHLPPLPKNLDATDGLAAAVCHFFNPAQQTEKSYSGWGAFVQQEAHRVKK